MFLPDADTECLRQGDILKGLPFALLQPNEILLLGKQHTTGSNTLIAVDKTHRSDPEWLLGQLPVRLCFGAVITQCCDLETEKGRKGTPTIAIARLIPIPSGINLDSVRANKDPRKTTDPGYINLFHIPSHPNVDGKEWVVDFNMVFCIPRDYRPALLKSKVLQMEDRWRVKFKYKLAASWSRLTEEERAAGLHDPWNTSEEGNDMAVPVEAATPQPGPNGPRSS